MQLCIQKMRPPIQLSRKLEKQKHNSDRFTIPYNREELAKFLCVNRSALSHELSNMQKEGLIKYNKNKFEILSMNI